MTLRCISLMLIVTVNVAGWGQSRFPVTAAQIARVLSQGGVPIEESQVSLPASVVSTEPDPALDVLTVEPLGQDRARVKLACRTSGACLPFYARVDCPVSAFPAKFATQARSEILMHAGAHAVLVMDDAHSHIQVTVVSLENGSAGKWIRVASPDHKQTWLAEVIGPTLLRGNY